MRHASTSHAVPIMLLLLVAACGGGGGGGGGGNGNGPQGVVYVRASVGSDNNRGDSPAAALQTIQAGVNKAKGGERVVVGPGRYVVRSGDVVVNIDGRRGPIEIIGDINGAETGDVPGAVEVNAGGRPFAFRFTDAAGFVVDGFTISGSSGANAAAIQIRTGSRDITIRNCEIAGNLGDGVRIENSSGITVFNNLVHANQARGIQIGSGTVDTDLINNTVTRNNNDGISGSGNGSSDLFLRNNLISQNGARGIDIRDSAAQPENGYNADFNLVFQRNGALYGGEVGRGDHDINTDPLFTAEFHLSQTSSGQPETSPAVDAGDPATNAQLQDALRARTTKTDLGPDLGQIDIGYHYPGLFEPPPTRTLPRPTTPSVVATPTRPPTVSPQLYVRIAGNDANDGRSPATALRTIQEAANRAGPGTEIVVGPGIYLENIRFRAPGGSAPAPVVVRANPSGDRTGDPAGDVLIDAQGAGNGIFIDAAPYVVIDGFRVTNGIPAGIQIRSGSTGSEVRHCELFNNGEDGLRIQDSDDIVVFNNLMYCNIRRGVLVGGSIGANRNQLVNNTIAQNGDRGVFIGSGSAASKNTQLRNNIIQNNRVAEIQVVTEPSNSLQGIDINYNLVFDDVAGSGQYNGADPGPNDILAPAGFVDIASCDPLELHDADYRLAQAGAGQAPDSPGIDTADPATAARFADVLVDRTTATDNAADREPLDMGYHFLP